MRDVIVITIIFVLVFGGDIFVRKYLKNTSEELLKCFEEMSLNFETNSEQKMEKVNQVISIWEEKEKGWIIFEYHDNINEIEDFVIEAYSYYLNNNKAEFNVSYRKLKRMVQDLRNRVDLSLENVL